MWTTYNDRYALFSIAIVFLHKIFCLFMTLNPPFPLLLPSPPPPKNKKQKQKNTHDKKRHLGNLNNDNDNSILDRADRSNPIIQTHPLPPLPRPPPSSPTHFFYAPPAHISKICPKINHPTIAAGLNVPTHLVSTDGVPNTATPSRSAALGLMKSNIAFSAVPSSSSVFLSPSPREVFCIPTMRTPHLSVFSSIFDGSPERDTDISMNCFRMQYWTKSSMAHKIAIWRRSWSVLR